MNLTLSISASVPHRVARQLAKINECVERLQRCDHALHRARNRRRALHYARRAYKLWDKWSHHVELFTHEELTQEKPPHHEPNYEHQ